MSRVRPYSPAIAPTAAKFTPAAAQACDLAYVAQSDDGMRTVKVGRSSDPAARFAGLRAGVPFELKLVAILSAGQRREREMKDMLVANRVRGEWFLPSNLLNEYLQKAAKEGALLKKHATDADFVHAHVLPLAVGYLEGKKKILYNDYGNFLYRFLREPCEAFDADKFRLTACGVSAEVLHGYLPTLVGAEVPQIIVPAGVEASA